MTTTAAPPLVIAFEEEAHVYTVNGEPWISVTQILERTGLMDFSYLPANVRQRAMSRGRRVHRAVHFLGEDDLLWSTVDEHEKGYVEACANFLAASGFEMAGHERRLAHPILKYAGTCDAFGWWEGRCAIADWCCGDLWESCKHLQTSGYCEAMRYAPPVEFFDFTPSTPIVRLGVHLKKNAKFSVEVFNDPRDFSIFSCAVTVAQYQLRSGKKGRKAA